MVIEHHIWQNSWRQRTVTRVGLGVDQNKMRSALELRLGQPFERIIEVAHERLVLGPSNRAAIRKGCLDSPKLGDECLARQGTGDDAVVVLRLRTIQLALVRSQI